MDHAESSRIVAVEARTVRVPLRRPTSFSTRQVLARDYALVRVRTADGGDGIGLCYCGTRAGELVTSAVRLLFAPLLLGKSALHVEGLWEQMYQESLLHGRVGSVMRALSAIDIALWDRNARAAGLPLADYLGGTGAQTVPAYASGGYYLEGKTPAMLAAELLGYVKAGFRAVKMKVGRGDPRSEEERVRAAAKRRGAGSNSARGRPYVKLTR
jgi:L-alanine-DL-glutamate epimerase-like enolase superfamily enzyme